ncbi:glycosyl hydrolase [Fulvivirgaceae bacterium BMA12]|uniref:Glycosyl hydrolase n=1 Tax=Agaribacillus aureus TaxID=3051825 RepID=A0ABT8LH26_9BACT|nr:glycosyl hydrolase [Fulvivirgaceae bacterium BMA12]
MNISTINNKLFLAWIIGMLFNACQPISESNSYPHDMGAEKASLVDRQTPKRSFAKFEPEDGKVILFVGQELDAIGGLKEFNDGYLDHFKKPAGWTAYTSLMPGDSTTFGGALKGLDGIWSTDTWGDGYSNMSLQAAHFDNMALAIGLAMVNREAAVANGDLDHLVEKFAKYLKSLAPRPIFLRIGYEFDGHSWNHYDRANYLKAYRRIKDKLDDMGCTNVAYVWQSTGWVSNLEMLEEWYPGDEYVDWCGFSFFSRWEEQKMIAFARKKGKPVFIAEASPNISDHTVKFDGDTKETLLSNPQQAREAWEKWFMPFFATIDENPDLVKAVSYINCNWKEHDLWKENPTFRDIDARLQTSEFISEKWQNIISQEKYLHSSPDLYTQLRIGEKIN